MNLNYSVYIGMGVYIITISGLMVYGMMNLVGKPHSYGLIWDEPRSEIPEELENFSDGWTACLQMNETHSRCADSENGDYYKLIDSDTDSQKENTKK